MFDGVMLGKPILICLLDSRSTSSFLRKRVLDRLSQLVVPSVQCKVCVVDGSVMSCSAIVP